MTVIGRHDQAVWMFLKSASDTESAETWTPFRRIDQERLTDAEARRIEEEISPVVLVDGGRGRVDLVNRLFHHCYGGQPCQARAVRRALWFYKGEHGLAPYEESVCTVVEALYEKMCVSAENGENAKESFGMLAEIEECVNLPHPRQASQVRLKLKCQFEPGWPGGSTAPTWELSGEEEKCDSSWLDLGRLAVKRGFGHVPFQLGEVEEVVLGDEVSKLFVLVHGVGEKVSSKEGYGMDVELVKFRRNMHRCQLMAAGFSQNGTDGIWECCDGAKAQTIPRFEVVQAPWWQTIHTEQLDSRLEAITLPSLPDVRKLAANQLTDMVFCLQDRRKTMDSLSQAIEVAVASFRQCHPTFNGDIVLVGHSLGGNNLFELLSGDTQLSFVPSVLFTLGAPTGLFLHCANNVPPASFTMPGGTRFYNIFHPMDPVAYRMEPLFSAELKRIQPKQIPKVEANGQESALQELSRWAAARKLIGDGGDQERAAIELWEEAGIQLNAGERLDWVLHEDSYLNMIGWAGEMMQALPSHSNYFSSIDVASFIFVQCAGGASDLRDASSSANGLSPPSSPSPPQSRKDSPQLRRMRRNRPTNAGYVISRDITLNLELYRRMPSALL